MTGSYSVISVLSLICRSPVGTNLPRGPSTPITPGGLDDGGDRPDSTHVSQEVLALYALTGG